MTTPLEKVNDLAGLQEWLDHYCETKPYSCWHQYGPSDLSLYEAQKPKIMLVNAESGGYDGCKRVPADEYLKWIRGGKKRWPTPRYGSVLVSFIRRYAHEMREGGISSKFDRSLWSRLYQDTDALIEKMRATIYMNARVTSSDSDKPHEQKAAVMADAREFACYRKRFVEILRPDFIICGGTSARDAIFHSGGVFEPTDRVGDSVFSRGQCIVVITPHLSRPGLFGGYKHLDEIARKCAALHAEHEIVRREGGR